MQTNICLLGNDSIYTKMVCSEFDRKGIKYSLILENQKSVKRGFLYKILSIPLKIDNLLNSGKYKSLPLFNIFTLKLLVKDFMFRRSKIYQQITKKYFHYSSLSNAVFYTPDINHIRTAKIIEENNFDIGIFAGVGIVDGLIIEKFNKYCLNAHPAPLPQCRGGGALENTLFYGLKPAVSVHYATSKIDEGKILRVSFLEDIERSDDFNIISLKLSLSCAKTLSDVVGDILENKPIQTISNNGILHYWKDCTTDRQKKAHNNLKKLLRKLNA